MEATFRKRYIRTCMKNKWAKIWTTSFFLFLDTIESEEASWAEGNWYQSNDLEELPSPSPKVIGRNQLPTLEEEVVELGPLN